MSRLVRLIGAMLLAAGVTQAARAAGGWDDLAFLFGTWAAEDSSGSPGKAARGETVFEPQLDGQVVVRRNFAEYPPARGRPASRHDDLMVIYRAGSGAPIRAKYFDNEGHVIDYGVTAVRDTVVFLGDAVPGTPRFRLTYRKLADERVAGEFAIAKPETPDGFQPYLAWTMKRSTR
ncbi:MAG TPA: hypothetical protein VFP44_08495 [Usitatibacter sp.]|nr:hypothetical protein [Usitatibacter sp.]